jgi:hypothetical protein
VALAITPVSASFWLTEYKIRESVQRIKDKTNVNLEVTEPCYARKWNSLLGYCFLLI